VRSESARSMKRAASVDFADQPGQVYISFTDLERKGGKGGFDAGTRRNRSPLKRREAALKAGHRRVAFSEYF